VADAKYPVIAAQLREAIQRGEYGPGERLPGENEIMRDQRVSRGTARQALAMLVNEGLATARRGAGVFVRDFRPIIRSGISRLAAGTWGEGRSIWSEDIGSRDLQVDQVEVSTAGAPERVGALLTLGEGDQVVRRSRRFVLDGKPVLLSVSYLPAKLVAGSRIEQVDTGPGGTYARLSDLGHPPEHFREDLRSRMPGPEEAERLEIGAGTPVTEIIRTAYTADDQVVEVNEMTADASAYVFRYDFGA
jgi:GntR family transcriptional regulator